MKLAVLVGTFVLGLFAVASASAYSVLTHEEVVDLLWAVQIQPLILARYPGLTPQQLVEAHAYAYGGSVIQDLGYYPFGSKEFSDLAHYVRSGDLVREMLLESRDANEYAFALGALAHYVSDVDGHPAVNQAVAIEYPRLRSRFGRFVTYDEDKTAHLKTEFGFDVDQVGKHRYAPDDYRNFIGFEVSEPLLERVFPVVYGIDLKEALPHEDLAVGSYRWAISQLIPRMTKAAAELRKKELKRHPNTQAEKVFLYHLSRADYRRKWGRDYHKPSLGTRFLAMLLSIVPKIGPFKGFAYKQPTPATEDLYVKSIDKTFADYRTLLEATRTGAPELPDRDLDDGAATRIDEYPLADKAYAKLLKQLAASKFAATSAALRDNILAFYANAPAPRGRRARKQWREVKVELQQLKAAAPAAQIADAVQ